MLSQRALMKRLISLESGLEVTTVRMSSTHLITGSGDLSCLYFGPCPHRHSSPWRCALDGYLGFAVLRV